MRGTDSTCMHSIKKKMEKEKEILERREVCLYKSFIYAEIYSSRTGSRRSGERCIESSRLRRELGERERHISRVQSGFTRRYEVSVFSVYSDSPILALGFDRQQHHHLATSRTYSTTKATITKRSANDDRYVTNIYARYERSFHSPPIRVGLSIPKIRTCAARINTQYLDEAAMYRAKFPSFLRIKIEHIFLQVSYDQDRTYFSMNR